MTETTQTSPPLLEVDSLEVLVIVDNELDPISKYVPTIVAFGNLGQVGMTSPHVPTDRGEGVRELRMNQVCCAAHGLSLMITTTREGRSSTILFDTGPEEDVWERNVKRLKPDLSLIDVIVLSHWHRDHSGGMLKAISMIKHARQQANLGTPVIVDLHPDRPDYRGFQAPTSIVSLEADPSFAEVEASGAELSRNADAHVIADGLFCVSGEIPRLTSYEKGLLRGLRFSKSASAWTPDTLIRDERFVMCNLKGRGIVVFTGCSHAGVVNATRHAVNLAQPTMPLYAVMGGFHLADAEPPQIEQTALDLFALGAKVLLPGHCTGWRFSHHAESLVPGCLAPSKTGMKLVFA